MDAIEAALKGLLLNYSQGDVRGAIDWLENEGHIYSTIDAYHFKSTDG